MCVGGGGGGCRYVYVLDASVDTDQSLNFLSQGLMQEV